MADATYTARFNTPWINPVHPGAAPVHAAGATARAISETNRQYAADLKEFTTFMQVTNDLKRMLLAAVDNDYTEILEDAEMGYADVNPIDILDHLVDQYGEITNADLEANRDRLKEAWDPSTDIEKLWVRIRVIKQFAAQGNVAITDATVMTLTLQMFEKENIFETDVGLWHRKSTADKTWENFKAHFTAAAKEFNRVLTARGAGLNAAALTATQEAANPEPTQEPNPEPTNDAEKEFVCRVVEVGTYKMYYCWTHGLNHNKAHTSATCNNKAEGHQDDATVDDIKGGSTSFFPPRKRGGNNRGYNRNNRSNRNNRNTTSTT